MDVEYWCSSRQSIKTHKITWKCTDSDQKWFNNVKVINLQFKFNKGQRVSFLFSTPLQRCQSLFCSQPLILLSFSSPPLVHPPPLPPPLDILSHYKAWFGSLVCVHVVPLCKRPRLKLCGKSSASFLNTPRITVQGLRGDGGGEK